MEPKGRLTDIRREIADLDRTLLGALEQRAALSKEIRALSEAEGTPLDAGKDYVQLIDEHPEGSLPKEALRSIFAQVASTARAIERPVRVAYVGTEGGFCHLLAKDHFGASATLVECPTVPAALDEVRRKRSSFGVFPFDSSVDGLIVTAVSALADTDLVFIAERTQPARLCLMNRAGKASDIERVCGTSIAHAASELYRKRELSHAAVVDVRSPVEAARSAQEDAKCAAVVPEATGRAFGLEVAQDNIGDESDLRYRYGIVGSRPASRSGTDTTCLLFSLDDAPGTLFSFLRHFAERGINLKKIQSRPARGASWDYLFYVEVSGHVTDRAVVTALEAVKGSTKYLKLLGSFPTEPVASPA